MSAKIIALHREIKLRREREKRLRGPQRRPSIAALRVAELSRLFRHRYGLTLPLDDAGFEDAQIMAHHLVGLIGDPRKRITNWLKLMMPSLSFRRAAAIIETAIHRPRRWRAETLGKLLGLTDAERSSLRITTIGAMDTTKVERLQRSKQLRRDRERKRRAKQSTRSREEYLSTSVARTKPWQAEGISRRTWYRRRKMAQVPCPP
jgi:hypothetical protein